MRIAFLFYGITRSLSYTFPSIMENLFKPLDKNINYKYDIFLHTYELDIITNIRAREINVKPNNDEWKLLKPLSYKIENQNEIDKILNFEHYISFGNPWPKDKNYETLKNLIRQQHSLQEVYKLFESHQSKNKIHYDIVIIVRPDLQFLIPLNINEIINKTTNNDDICMIPDFHWYKNEKNNMKGCNDRFICCSSKIAYYYCNRILYADEFMKSYGSLHSESFLYHVLSKFNIKITPFKFPFHRIRANGFNKDKDKIK